MAEKAIHGVVNAGNAVYNRMFDQQQQYNPEALIRIAQLESLNDQQAPYVLQPIYDCENCDFQTQNKQLMLQHKQSCVVKRDQPKIPCFTCDYCCSVFQEKSHLSIHSQKCQFAHNKIYKCDRCDLKFIQVEKLVSHFQNHGQDLTDINSKCPKCFAILASQQQVREHVKTCPEFAAQRCNFCNPLKLFESAQQVEQHNATVHGVCRHCGDPFNSKKECLEHARQVHYGGLQEKMKHTCPYCKLLFPDQNDLKDHVGVCKTEEHEPPQPKNLAELMLCDGCNKLFIGQAEADAHRCGGE